MGFSIADKVFFVNISILFEQLFLSEQHLPLKQNLPSNQSFLKQSPSSSRSLPLKQNLSLEPGLPLQESLPLGQSPSLEQGLPSEQNLLIEQNLPTEQKKRTAQTTPGDAITPTPGVSPWPRTLPHIGNSCFAATLIELTRECGDNVYILPLREGTDTTKARNLLAEMQLDPHSGQGGHSIISCGLGPGQPQCLSDAIPIFLDTIPQAQLVTVCENGHEKRLKQDKFRSYVTIEPGEDIQNNISKIVDRLAEDSPNSVPTRCDQCDKHVPQFFEAIRPINNTHRAFIMYVDRRKYVQDKTSTYFDYAHTRPPLTLTNWGTQYRLSCVVQFAGTRPVSDDGYAHYIAWRFFVDAWYLVDCLSNGKNGGPAKKALFEEIDTSRTVAFSYVLIDPPTGPALDSTKKEQSEEHTSEESFCVDHSKVTTRSGRKSTQYLGQEKTAQGKRVPHGTATANNPASGEHPSTHITGPPKVNAIHERLQHVFGTSTTNQIHSRIFEIEYTACIAPPSNPSRDESIILLETLFKDDWRSMNLGWDGTKKVFRGQTSETDINKRDHAGAYYKDVYVKCDKLFVVDLDNWTDLTRRFIETVGPRCNCISLTRKGAHYYFQGPIPDLRGKQLDGLDIRTGSGLVDGKKPDIVFAPPSTYGPKGTDSFTCYTWHVLPSTGQLMQCPQDAVDVLRNGKPVRAKAPCQIKMKVPMVTTLLAAPAVTGRAPSPPSRAQSQTGHPPVAQTISVAQNSSDRPLIFMKTQEDTPCPFTMQEPGTKGIPIDPKGCHRHFSTNNVESMRKHLQKAHSIPLVHIRQSSQMAPSPSAPRPIASQIAAEVIPPLPPPAPSNSFRRIHSGRRTSSGDRETPKQNNCALSKHH